MSQALPFRTVNVNGTLTQVSDIAHTPTSAQVSVFDRSYLYGDSLYEVARSYGGKLRFVREHLERLEKSAVLCHMRFSQTLEHFAAEMERTTADFYTAWAKASPSVRAPDVYCRLIVSRGTGRIGFGLSNLETPTTYTVITQPLDEPTREQWEMGANYHLAARIRNHPQAIDPAMKSGNYLNCLLAFLEAQDAGCDDALLSNADGHLTEGTTFNLFYVRRGIVATAPLDIGILDGITRRGVIEVARELGLPVREVRYDASRLWEADEVFMTSTTKEVFPVTRLNGKPVGARAHLGKPGPITRKLKENFYRFIETRHPELRLGAHL